MNPQILIILILFTLILISAAYLNQTASFKKEMGLAPLITPVPTQNNSSPSESPSNSANLSEFIYPNSTTKPDLPTNITTLLSNDDSSVITNWYKNKIKNVGMNTTSFVQTSTNGNVLNKLVGSDGKRELEVQISKSNKAQEVEIRLNVNN